MENHRDTGCRGCLMVVVLWLGVIVNGAAAQSPEMRAMWVSRFEWPSTNQLVAKANINAIMSDLAAANFNAVFMQMRGQADVLYPSPFEVWSPIIGGSDPGWDPLDFAITAAHANGLEFHCYINTHTCWQSGSATPPSNPAHLFYDHCNAADPNARDWLIHDVAGNPVQFHESSYVWIAPGLPAFQAYLRQQIMHIVVNYAVDGIHFDRIRTPNSAFSYDPISLARFNDPQSNPDGLSFHPWTADQITRNNADIYAAIMAVKPDVKVSAAVFSNSNTAPTDQHQAALAWAQGGSMDILVPMIYFSGGAGSTWDTRLIEWLNGAADRHVVAGQITSVGLTTLESQIGLTRLRGGEGNNVFSYSSFAFFNDYLADVYQTAVAPPAMSWKDNPTTGIIHGLVTDAGGQAVVDAQIVRNGSGYTALSTGDGYYSMLLAPAGTYSLTASHPAFDPVVVNGVVVQAGQVVLQDIAFATAVPPIIADVTPDPDIALVDEDYVRQLIVTQGGVDNWSLTIGPGGIDGNGLLSGWIPSAAQAGQLIDFTVRATNSAGFDDESWSVLVEALPVCTSDRLTDFEGFANGAEVMFKKPGFSGSTSGDLAASPDVAEVTNAVAAFNGTSCYQVEWRYLDADPQRWMRLTSFNAASIPNPTIALDRPIRVRLRVENGSFLLSLGIRETATSADIGQDGGTSGSIEWLGAATVSNGAPQGVLVTASPGDWQTFIFDPLSDPVSSFTGDGVLGTVTNKGVLEHLAFSFTDTVGPLLVYVDDIDQLCDLPAFGDLNNDGEVGPGDYAIFWGCLAGPNVIVDGGCLLADFDGDQDVDLEDADAFMEAFTGPI